MGIFRLALSLLVVGSHFGGLPTLAGGASVAAFFVISGYLMALVIERAYGTSASGAGRFWLNRALRLVPLFLLYSALSIALLRARDQVGFFIEPKQPLYLPAESQGFLGIGPKLHLELNPLSIAPAIDLMPQAWSLITEGVFYVVAPLLVLAYRRARWTFFALFVASFALSTYYTFEYASTSWLRSPVSSVWIFMLGMLLFFGEARLRGRVRDQRSAAVILAVLSVWIIVRWRTLDPTIGFYLLLALSVTTVALLASIRDWPPWFRRVDRSVGDIAYGVFVNQFFAAMLIYVVADILFEKTGHYAAFGRVSDPRLHYPPYIASVLLAIVTFFALERPLQRARDRVRPKAAAPGGRAAAEETPGRPAGGRVVAGVAVATVVALFGLVLAAGDPPTARWSAAQTVAPGAGVRDLQVGAALNGAAVLTYAQGGDAFVAIRPGGGPRFDAPQTLAGATLPRLAVGPIGGALVAWRAGDSVHASFRGSAHEPLRGLGPIGGRPESLFTAFGPDGTAVVVWSERRTGKLALLARWFAADGSLSEETPLTADLGADRVVCIALDSGGLIALLTTPDGALLAARAPRAGALSTPAEVVDRAGAGPALASDWSGNAVAAFARGGAVWVASAAPGGPFGTPKRLGAGASPTITENGFGTITIAWLDPRGRVRRAAGPGAGPLEPLSSVPGGEATAVQVADNPQGRSLLAVIGADGKVADGTSALDEAAPAGGLALAGAADGTGVAAWVAGGELRAALREWPGKAATADIPLTG